MTIAWCVAKFGGKFRCVACRKRLRTSDLWNLKNNGNDLDACLGNELVQFVDFVDTFKDEQAQGVSRDNFMYSLILQKLAERSRPTGILS